MNLIAIDFTWNFTEPGKYGVFVKSEQNLIVISAIVQVCSGMQEFHLLTLIRPR